MTPFPNGTGPANADTGPPAPHAAAGTGGTSAIGGAHGRPCLSGAAFRRFTLPALLGLLLLAAPLHAAYGTESGTPPSGDMEWKGEASTPSRRCPTLPFDGELTLGAGGSVSSSPYKGYGPDWLPFPMITYEGERFFIRGYTAGVKIINLPYLELSAFAGYDSTSFEASESSNRRLRRLEDRSPSAQAGMELRLLSPYGMFHVSGAGDVLSHSNGFNGDIGFIQSIEFGPLELLPAVGAYWSDARYNSYYYGVTRKGSPQERPRRLCAGLGLCPVCKLRHRLQPHGAVGTVLPGGGDVPERRGQRQPHGRGNAHAKPHPWPDLHVLTGRGGGEPYARERCFSCSSRSGCFSGGWASLSSPARCRAPGCFSFSPSPHRLRRCGIRERL